MLEVCVCVVERKREIKKSLKIFLFLPSIAVSVTIFGELLDFGQVFKALATINLPNSPTFLGNFC